jgi:predicted lipoprotein
VQDRQVTPLVTENATGKQARLPFERSGLSARYVVAAIQSLKQLHEAMNLDKGVPGAKTWMTEWIAQAWGRLAVDAPAALKAQETAKEDAERKRQLRMLRFHVEGIRKLVGRELAPLAGLQIGFNELDGD